MAAVYLDVICEISEQSMKTWEQNKTRHRTSKHRQDFTIQLDLLSESRFLVNVQHDVQINPQPWCMTETYIF